MSPNSALLTPGGSLSTGGLMTKQPTLPGVLLDFYGNPIGGSGTLLYFADYDPDPTGNNDSSAQWAQFVNDVAANSTPGYLGPGTFIVYNGKTPLQSSGFFNIFGAGRGATILRPTGIHDVLTIQMPGRASDFSMDWSVATGSTGLNFTTTFQGKQTYTASATGSTTSITIDAGAPAAFTNLLVPGAVICLAGAHLATDQASYTGTIVSYNPGTRVVTIATNFYYPSGTLATVPVGTKIAVGTALNPINDWSAERIGILNRPSGSGGFGIIFQDATNGYPFQVAQCKYDDIYGYNIAQTSQEMLQIACVRRSRVVNCVMDNTDLANSPRSVINTYAYDYLYMENVQQVVGTSDNSVNVGATLDGYYGGLAVAEVQSLRVYDPHAACTKNVPCNGNDLKALGWRIPATVNVQLNGTTPSAPAPGPAVAKFIDCNLLGGVNWQNPMTRVVFVGGKVGVNSGQGCFNFFCGNQDTGPIYISGSTDVASGTSGTVFFQGQSNITFEVHWEGGSLTFTTGFTWTNSTMDATSTVKDVKGINPVGSTALANAFAMPTSTHAWTNGTGTSVDLYLATGSLSALSINGVSVANLTGPWRIEPGGTFTPTYVAATVTPVYQ